MPSSQTPRPMPKPTGPSRDEVKARVRAKIEAEKALPASERIAHVLHATHSTADAVSLLNRFRAEVLREVYAAIEDPAQRRAVGGGLGWETARDVVHNMLRRITGGAS